MDTVYLNGDYLPKQNAKISIMDRGFLFGDSIYEIIPNHCGKLIGAEEHYTRMQQSLNAVLIDCPFKTLAALTDVCYQLIERNQQQQTDCGIYFQI